MNHKRRVERHIIVDILAGACGAAAIAAVLQRSWMASILAVVILLALLLLERETIEEEETQPQYQKEDKVRLPETIVTVLTKIAARPQLECTFATTDDRTLYDAGVSDGATDLAKYVLEQMKEETNA